MKEFTSEWIAEQKEILNNSITKSNQLAGTDDTVVVGVYGYDEEVGYYDYNPFADCGNKSDAEFIYNACLNYPKALDHIERLQKRVQELEVQLKSKDIIINNQQGRLNYYATKDLLGGKHE